MNVIVVWHWRLRRNRGAAVESLPSMKPLAYRRQRFDVARLSSTAIPRRSHPIESEHREAIERRPKWAVLQTPPYELLLAVVPDGAVDDLVITLHARQVWVPGVYGDSD